MDKAFIVGVGLTPMGRLPEWSVKDLTRAAVTQALQDAGIAQAQVEAAWFSNVRQGQMEGQNSIRGQCALRSMGFAGIPIVNVENACASSSTALIQAWAAIRAGMCDIALVVGADKLFFPEKRALMFEAFLGGTDIYLREAFMAQLRGAAGDGPLDEGDAKQRSFFMDIYALWARQHMQRFGTTARQMAIVAAKNHDHAVHNPNAQYRFPMTAEAVLQDAPVSWPLTRAMCAPISDGACALLLCSDKARARLGHNRAIRIRAAVLRSSTDRAVDDYDAQTSRLAAQAAYVQAGIGAAEIDVAEVHDATSFAEILQAENLGLVERGQGGWSAERGETRLGGRIPINTSGGLVCKGHPIGATGAAMMHEIVTQLRGEAGARQVSDARHGMIENGGGFWGVEEAATCVTILSRD